MKKSHLLIVAAILAVSAMAVAANAAQNAGQGVTGQNGQAGAAVSALKAKASSTVSARCATVNGKIDVKLANFDNGQERRVTAYRNMKSRLSGIVAKLTEQGVDVSDLMGDLVELDSNINSLSQNYRSYVEGLGQAKKYDCGESQGQFRNQLSTSRRQLTQVRQDVLAIRKLYSSSIKPHLMQAREQLRQRTANRASSSAVTSANE